jgi:phosphohistidine phosphatase SixA
MFRCLVIFLFALCVSAQDATLILLRHAERSGTAAPDPITPAGQERAQLIARMLGEAGVTRIVVSETVRSQQTAKPLAKRLNLQSVLSPRGDVKALIALLRRAPTNSTTVAVRHSDEIPQIAKALGTPVADFSETEYDRMLILTLRNGKAVSLKLLRFGR